MAISCPRCSGPSLTGFPSLLTRRPLIALARRGSDDACPPASACAVRRAPRLIPAAAFFLVIAIGSGAWYFYNAHVLNEYLTAQDRRDIQAGLRA